jgi:hypothetical protein
MTTTTQAIETVKLTNEQYQRSLKAKMNHLWLYSKYETTQRTHNNSIFLTKTIGSPFACLVVEYDKCICDEDIESIFGKGTFIDGAVSPNDKENMLVDSFYVKNL